MTDAHWDLVHADKPGEEQSWYEATPRTLDDVVGLTETDSAIIDIGSGDGGIIPHLAELGYHDLSGLDISSEALAAAERRLAAAASPVDLVHADVLTFAPDRQWDLWHDRAVFHFLVSPSDRRAYRRTLARAVRPGGHAVIAVFAPAGPASCAGLPTARYGEEALADEFADVLTCRGCRGHRAGAKARDQRPYTICTFERPAPGGPAVASEPG